jgi:hypothetical protein
VLLLFTGSRDGTSDRLVQELGTNVFRFNYDLFKDYRFQFTPDYWEISNPAGHSINSNTVTSAFWWKAFSFYLMDEEPFIVEEAKYVCRELYHWCRLRGLTKGNPHDFHNHMGKMNILDIASKHFQIPDTLITLGLVGIEKLQGKPIVAKSLTSGLTTTNKALFTTEVKAETLHPEFQWFLQEKITSDADITIFLCGDKQFAFSRSRADLEGLDWRKEQNFDMSKKEWFVFPLTEKQSTSIAKFANDLGVDFGRLDLMTLDEELIFLEFNANGQWVFLDYDGEVGLVKTVAEYLLP